MCSYCFSRVFDEGQNGFDTHHGKSIFFKSVTKVASQHAMIYFRTAINPLNFLPQHVTDALTKLLKTALRADPAGTGGKVKYRMYESKINCGTKSAGQNHTS